jgi:hypothetical protein
MQYPFSISRQFKDKRTVHIIVLFALALALALAIFNTRLSTGPSWPRPAPSGSTYARILCAYASVRQITAHNRPKKYLYMKYVDEEA